MLLMPHIKAKRSLKEILVFVSLSTLRFDKNQTEIPVYVLRDKLNDLFCEFI